MHTFKEYCNKCNSCTHYFVKNCNDCPCSTHFSAGYFLISHTWRRSCNIWVLGNTHSDSNNKVQGYSSHIKYSLPDTTCIIVENVVISENGFYQRSLNLLCNGLFWGLSYPFAFNLYIIISVGYDVLSWQIWVRI